MVLVWIRSTVAIFLVCLHDSCSCTQVAKYKALFIEEKCLFLFSHMYKMLCFLIVQYPMVLHTTVVTTSEMCQCLTVGKAIFC